MANQADLASLRFPWFFLLYKQQSIITKLNTPLEHSKNRTDLRLSDSDYNSQVVLNPEITCCLILIFSCRIYSVPFFYLYLDLHFNSGSGAKCNIFLRNVYASSMIMRFDPSLKRDETQSRKMSHPLNSLTYHHVGRLYH